MRDPWNPGPAGKVALAAGAVAALTLAAVLYVQAGPPDVTPQATPEPSNSTTSTTPAPSPAGSPTSQTTTPAPAPAGTPTGTPTTREDLIAAPTPGEATSPISAAAAAAVTAWQIPDPAARRAALAPLSTPPFLEVEDTIDPAAVPDAPVTTARTLADADGLALVEVTLADGTVLHVELEWAGAWLMSDIRPA